MHYSTPLSICAVHIPDQIQNGWQETISHNALWYLNISPNFYSDAILKQQFFFLFCVARVSLRCTCLHGATPEWQAGNKIQWGEGRFAPYFHKISPLKKFKIPAEGKKITKMLQNRPL